MADRTALAKADAGALLERDEELAQLRRLVQQAAEGRGGAAAIIGPAGIGKTSLLEAAGDACREAGLTCLSARGGELERDFPYGIVRQLYERTLRDLAADDRRTALGGAAARAAPVVGLEGDVGLDDGETFATLHGLYWLTANLAHGRPLALLVDDLHWADRASLRFLAYLVRRLEELPIVVLAGARPPIDVDQAELIGRMLAEPGTLTITLAALSEPAVGEMVEARLGAADPAFLHACFAATSGNPFLCATLVAALAEEGVPAEAGEAGRVTEFGSRAVSTVVIARLGRLPAAAQALARAVAVLGTDVELSHAATLAKLDLYEAASAADSLGAQGILRPGAIVDFVHPLVRAAIRDLLPAAERALAHAEAARLLAAAGQLPERTAAHLLAAAPAGEPWVVDLLRAAARSVSSRGDPATAVAYLRRALREPPDPASRASVVEELGVAEYRAGQPDHATAHLRDALSLRADPRERAGIARELALALLTRGRYAEAADALERAIGELGEDEPDLRLQLEAELHQTGMLEASIYPRVRDRLDRAGPDPPGDTPGQRALLAARATEASLRTEPAARVRELAVRAFDAGLLHDQTPGSAMWVNAAFPLVFAEGYADAERVAERAIEDAALRGSGIGSVRAYAARALVHLHRGALREAESDARTAVEFGREAGFMIASLAFAALVEALVERGDLDAADAELRAAGMDGELPPLFLSTWTQHARGRLRLAQARLDEAISDFERVGAHCSESGWRPWNPAMRPYRTGLAIALVRAGERARAREVALEELELSRRWGAPGTLGVSLRTLGLVEGGERGLRLLSESAGTLSGSEARLEHARSLVELGAALRRARHRSEAREPLRTGMALAHRCGARPLVEQARAELLATGARPRRIVRTGVDALTPSELRVSRLAAEGKTNREIAQALFITPRTVEGHLTHAYQKLEIERREQLPGALAQ